jgi:hypothetical protein
MTDTDPRSLVSGDGADRAQVVPSEAEAAAFP